MKKVVFIFICLGVFLLAIGCNTGAAVRYNDEIVNYQGKVIEKMLALSDAFQKGDSSDMEAKLKSLQLQIDESLAGLSKMQDFKGNFRLRDGAIALFEFYQSIAGTEYREIIDIISKGAENIQDYDRDRLVEIQKDITAREAEFDKELQAAQKEFALSNGIDIKGNKYQDQINQLGR
ncbi:MAG: hypothetical protein MUF15_07010 [Acidobacteria bacterium]|jgi:hypothetical protein|nr:hypothetical protein [Acidobacteriota bacterium]